MDAVGLALGLGQDRAGDGLALGGLSADRGQQTFGRTLSDPSGGDRGWAMPSWSTP